MGIIGVFIWEGLLTYLPSPPDPPITDCLVEGLGLRAQGSELNPQQSRIKWLGKRKMRWTLGFYKVFIVIWALPKLGVPSWGVLIMRILVPRGRYWCVCLLSDSSYSLRRLRGYVGIFSV